MIAPRRMPPEWDPHTATWMGFPRVSYAESGLSREDARRAWALVANTISEHEPVRMLCHPEDLKAADNASLRQSIRSLSTSTTPG